MNREGKPPRLRQLRWLARNLFEDAATPPCGDARRGISLNWNWFTASGLVFPLHQTQGVSPGQTQGLRPGLNSSAASRVILNSLREWLSERVGSRPFGAIDLPGEASQRGTT